ncbi:MAG: two-component regulator propeller domain-containing protein, partial [Chitinophagaceae bacterium]
MKSLLIWICYFESSAQSSYYNFSRVDVENGLSHNKVYSIYRDSVGFVWFGTASGLTRFDGTNCKVFMNITNDSTSLEDNMVPDVFPLPGNKLWIASKSSGCIYDPLVEKFDRNFRGYLKQLSLPQARVLSSQKDKAGNYWVMLEKTGLYKYSPATGKAYKFTVEKELVGKDMTSIREDAQGNMWFIFSNGYLLHVDARSMKPIGRLTALLGISKVENLNFQLFTDRQNKLWVYALGDPIGAFKIDPNTNSYIRFHKGDARFNLNDDMITGIDQDAKGTIWIGTDHGGVNLVDEADHSKISYLVSKENDKSTLSYNSVQRLYEDDKGLMWVGTGKKGANYINQNIVQFELYKYEADNKNSLPFNDINYFQEDRKGNVWIGTNGGGLLYFDKTTHLFTQYVNNPSNPNSLSNNIIVSLCLDHEDKLWVGTYWGGLDVFDGKNFIHY